MHGLTGSPDELAPLVEALREAGFTVRSPLLPGHGLDVAALAATDRHAWYSAAESALHELMAECGRVSIVGSSAGGLIGMLLAAHHRDAVTALVLLATPITLPRWSVFRIRAALALPAAWRPSSLRSIGKSDGINVSDPSLAEGLRSLPAYPLESLGELLALMGHADRVAPSIAQRVLIVHGDRDTTVLRPQVTALMARLASSKGVERVFPPRSAHLVAIDRDRDEVAASIIAFLRRSLS